MAPRSLSARKSTFVSPKRLAFQDETFVVAYDVKSQIVNAHPRSIIGLSQILVGKMIRRMYMVHCSIPFGPCELELGGPISLARTTGKIV